VKGRWVPIGPTLYRELVLVLVCSLMSITDKAVFPG